jgi:hypothetical protein
MKKKLYLLLSVFVFIFILGNFVSSLPAIPRSTSNPSDFATENQGSPESIDFGQQVEDDNTGGSQSKGTVDTRNQFFPSATDPTAGDFDYSETTLPYNWEDATGGTWNDLSMSDSVMLMLPFEFPFYGENFTNIFVSRHGWMSFYNTDPSNPWVGLGSTDESSWYAVAPYATPIASTWGNPGVYNLTLSSPSRYVIEYNNVMHAYYSEELVGTFQVVFYDNGTIDFSYDWVQNTYDFPYSIGLNHGAIWSNYEQHTISSFPIDNLTLRFDPPKKWLFITSDDESVSTDYNLTWEGHSNETIVVYHVFLNFVWYATTPLEFMFMTGLPNGWNWIEVYMETGGMNYTTGVQVIVDTDDPIVTIDYPSDMATLNDGKVNWTYSDPTTWIEYFEVYVNDSFHQRVDWENFIYLALENLKWYNVTVFAYDALGHNGSDTVTFYYDRTVPAAGFITTHFEDDMWEVRSLYMDRGYLTGLITANLTLDNLTLYDVIFIGGGGGPWPSSDIAALEAFVNGGGKLFVADAGFPEGLHAFMADLGISREFNVNSLAGNTTYFESDHPLMTGVTELQHYDQDNTYALNHPARELIRTSDGQNIIGAVSEVGESKVFCMDYTMTWDLYKTDNYLVFANIFSYWLTLPLHDLSASIDSPAGAGAGSTIDVYSYVINQGSSTEGGFTLQLWVNGTLEDSLYVTTLDSGESAFMHSQVLAPASGTINLTSYVAPISGETLTYNNREEKTLAVYEITIYTPTTGEQVRGGLVFVNYTGSDVANLVNITVFVNDAWITHVHGVSSYPELTIFVPVFQNGTNTITLMGTWHNGAQANGSVTIESYLVVPRVEPTYGDYVFMDMHASDYSIQVLFNFTFLNWISPFEINCSMTLNQTQMGMPVSYVDTWYIVNVLNGYISDGWPGAPPGESWVYKHLLIIPGISVPESIPYSTSIDENSFPAANIGDPACFVEWHEILRVTSTGEWNGYASFNLSIDLGYGMLMNVTVLQCSGLFVYINQFGMVMGEVVTNMLPPIDRPPLISTPDDIYVEYGTTGNFLTWYVSGNNPDGYALYKDDVSVDSGDWYIGVPYVVDLDSLSLGSYNYTLQLWDSNGEWSSDIVWVYVQDTTSPTIDTPVDIYYNEDDTGYSITWSPSDLLPSSYVIYMEGSVLISGAWNSSAESITVSVDGLAFGAYNYTIVVTDTTGHSTLDQVWVYVQDGTAPTIDHPADFDYDEGETGNTIIWNPDDSHPKNFTIYKDGTVENSGSWDGSTITIDVDGLSPGVYNYTIVVYDLGGNSVTDTVVVTVNEVVITPTTPTTPTTTPTPTGGVELPPEIMLLIIGGLGGAVVIIIIVALLRKRGG